MDGIPLKTQIHNKLIFESELMPQGICVLVKNEVVTLIKSVYIFFEKYLADRVSKNIRGFLHEIRNVLNYIIINSSSLFLDSKEAFKHIMGEFQRNVVLDAKNAVVETIQKPKIILKGRYVFRKEKTN